MTPQGSLMRYDFTDLLVSDIPISSVEVPGYTGVARSNCRRPPSIVIIVSRSHVVPYYPFDDILKKVVYLFLTKRHPRFAVWAATGLMESLLVLQIEERYALGDDAEDEDASSPGAAPQPAEGSGAPVLLHSNAAFDDSRDHDAPYTDSHQGAGAALTEHPGVAKKQQGGFQGFGDEVEHQADGPDQPERDEQQAKQPGQDGWGNKDSNLVENRIEGLPEGELLSPPQLPQGKPVQLAAQIDFGQAGAAGDGWDDWDEDIGSSFA